jgi:hypothetical protein
MQQDVKEMKLILSDYHTMNSKKTLNVEGCHVLPDCTRINIKLRKTIKATSNVYEKNVSECSSLYDNSI